jgi:hypothetical protein
MTTRATFRQADLDRAIRAADAAGKVVLWTPAGIVFVDPPTIALPSPVESGGNTCDGLFGVQP